MKLSIVIPVYRVETTLDRCVESVVTQDYDDFEIILVDDGSPDRCPKLCDEWARRDPRISVIHKPNGGLSDARNAGIDVARGDFLTFIDSDDYIAPHTLSQVMPLTKDADLIEYPIRQFPETSYLLHLPSSILHLTSHLYTDANDYWLQTKAYEHTYAWNKIYRRTLFADIRFPKGKVFEDAYTLPRLLHLRPRIMTTDRGCYHYYRNPHGITATATGNELRMLLDAHLASGMPVDDSYYRHLLNIQLDVYRLTGDAPRLQPRRLKLHGNLKQMLKALTLNILGIKGICKLHKVIHQHCR